MRWLAPLWKVDRNLPGLYHGALPGSMVCAFPAAVLGAEVSASARMGHSSSAPAWKPWRRPDTRVGKAGWTRGTWENPTQTVARTLATSRACRLPEPLRVHNHACSAEGRTELLVGKNPVCSRLVLPLGPSGFLGGQSRVLGSGAQRREPQPLPGLSELSFGVYVGGRGQRGRKACRFGPGGMHCAGPPPAGLRTLLKGRLHEAELSRGVCTRNPGPWHTERPVPTPPERLAPRPVPCWTRGASE